MGGLSAKFRTLGFTLKKSLKDVRRSRTGRRVDWGKDLKGTGLKQGHQRGEAVEAGVRVKSICRVGAVAAMRRGKL